LIYFPDVSQCRLVKMQKETRL